MTIALLKYNSNPYNRLQKLIPKVPKDPYTYWTFRPIIIGLKKRREQIQKVTVHRGVTSNSQFWNFIGDIMVWVGPASQGKNFPLSAAGVTCATSNSWLPRQLPLPMLGDLWEPLGCSAVSLPRTILPFTCYCMFRNPLYSI